MGEKPFLTAKEIGRKKEVIEWVRKNSSCNDSDYEQGNDLLLVVSVIIICSLIEFFKFIL